MDKYITPDGKKHLLVLGFLNDDNASNFNYVALGIEDSNAAINNGKGFQEANGYNYKRARFEKEENKIDDTGTSISVSAIFDSTNFNPSESINISEIGIVNQDFGNDSDTFFAYMSVPKIEKSSNVSLKYTIVITLE